MVFKIRIGFGLDHFGSDRIRILKFTNYRIGNFQSDPMHTFKLKSLFIPCEFNISSFIAF